MLPKATLILLSLRDVTLEQRTFKVSTSRLLYLNVEVFYLAEGSMIVLVKKSCNYAFKQMKCLRALLISL